MNRLVIIGNGFDLAHGLKTSYKNFIDWYWEQKREQMCLEHSDVLSDILCTMRLKNKNATWHNFAYNNSFLKNIYNNYTIAGGELVEKIKKNTEDFEVKYCPFFEAILKNIETKGWVDIEDEYYQQLKYLHSNSLSCKELNNQLHSLQEKLIEYLTTQKVPERKEAHYSIIIDEIHEQDISNEGCERALQDIESLKVPSSEKWIPEKIMLLSFNYTPTIGNYTNYNIQHNYIHGTLDKPGSIIFGFGDELDKDYKNIQETNDNELLVNVKSVRYLEAPNYRNLLRFIESAPFQVFIMGHSCGLSDRTLLNTIFEHKNCVSIKPFYYRKGDGTDNYLELVQNISRNFTDMKLFRDRVVNRTQCDCM